MHAEEIKAQITDFKIPKYNEIPDVGLYLEQVAKYISEYLNPLGEFTLTGSMISNYVKKGLITNPVKKQYSREQIAYLIFIAIAKSVASIEDIKLMIEIQKKTYTPEVAYNYIEAELTNILQFVFGIKESLDVIGSNNHEAKIMLRTAIITVAHKVYLDKYFEYYRENK